MRSSQLLRASDCQCRIRYTVESEGRQMKQCWIQYIGEKVKKIPLFKQYFLPEFSTMRNMVTSFSSLWIFLLPVGHFKDFTNNRYQGENGCGLWSGVYSHSNNKMCSSVLFLFFRYIANDNLMGCVGRGIILPLFFKEIRSNKIQYLSFFYRDCTVYWNYLCV